MNKAGHKKTTTLCFYLRNSLEESNSWRQNVGGQLPEAKGTVEWGVTVEWCRVSVWNDGKLGSWMGVIVAQPLNVLNATELYTSLCILCYVYFTVSQNKGMDGVWMPL